MSDPHDREPVDQATIDCWRTNYGLDKRTPAQAASWWGDNLRGLAPSGCVAALGVALDELDALRKDAERYRWIKSRRSLTLKTCGSKWTRPDGSQFIATHYLAEGGKQHSPADSLDAVIDTAMLEAPRVGAA